MRVFEGKMYLTCAKKCKSPLSRNCARLRGNHTTGINLNGEGDLQEGEKNCLRDCNGKLERYLRISKKNFKDVEGGLSEFVEIYDAASKKAKVKASEAF